MTIPLPEHLDTGAATAFVSVLRAALADGGTGPIQLDGTPVQRVGMAGVQLLIAARQSADAARRDFILSPVSQPLLDACTLVGAEPLLWSGIDPIVAEGSSDAA
ncbi:MAG TPA: STAS domain-containing protein [Sphingomonas sp.]|jgi:anti-anti-sigma regulatory factor|uniref:STAS domain-containing protein n=1 Tax=Sphingomonas sp. TaxID=28214 RepID=UPI002ED974D9